MRLTFLGTGTSMGVPIISCNCAVCTSDDPRNRRTRTAALIDYDDRRILIDAGPDFREQALQARISRLDAVLLTHSHYDHVGGLDDLRPLIAHGSSMPLYGYARTLRDVRERFSYAFATVDDGSTRPTLELHEITAGVPFAAGGVSVLPLDVQHGTWTITGFRIGRLGYITDASGIPPASMAQLADLDVLVLNALRYKNHPTHFSLEQALAVVAELKPQRTFLVHLTHAFDHRALAAELPAGVAPAHDGLQLDVAE